MVSMLSRAALSLHYSPLSLAGTPCSTCLMALRAVWGWPLQTIKRLTSDCWHLPWQAGCYRATRKLCCVMWIGSAELKCVSQPHLKQIISQGLKGTCILQCYMLLCNCPSMHVLCKLCVHNEGEGEADSTCCHV